MSALTSSITPFHFPAAQGPSLLEKAIDLLSGQSRKSARISVHDYAVTTTSPNVSRLELELRSAPASVFPDLLDQRANGLDAAFADAFSEATMMAEHDEIDVPDMDCWRLAHRFLAIFFGNPLFVSLRLPLIMPMDDGGVSAEWHEQGLNIEVRFRASRSAYAVIEDARTQIPEYRGRDPMLARVIEALITLARRSI
jgi:hypothetical protein